MGTFSGDPTHGQSIHYYPEVRGTKVGIRGPSGGSEIPKTGESTPRGALTYYLANFSRKLHENERIWTEGARNAPPPIWISEWDPRVLFSISKNFSGKFVKKYKTIQGGGMAWHIHHASSVLVRESTTFKICKSQGDATDDRILGVASCDKDNLLPSREKRLIGTWVLRQ